MGGHGRILSIYGGQQPHLDMVHALNLEPASIAIIQVERKLETIDTEWSLFILQVGHLISRTGSCSQRCK